MDKKLTMADHLTVGRLALIPIFIIFFVLKLYALALAAFALASFTDLIDGTVARLRKEHSELGALLDPIADKLLMITAFLCLTFVDVVMPWLVTILILRDVIIVGGYIYIVKWRKISFIPKPNWTGKFATLFEIITGVMALIFLMSPFAQVGDYLICDFLYGFMLITGFLIFISAVQYVITGIEVVQGNTSSNETKA